MRCMKCSRPASFEHVIYQGSSPSRLRLCPECAAKVEAEARIERIRSAAADSRHAEVLDLMRAVDDLPTVPPPS